MYMQKMKPIPVCNVCEGRQWNYLYETRDRMFDLPGTFSTYRCSRCGLLRLAPGLSQKKLVSYYPPRQYYSYVPEGKLSPLWKFRTFLIARRAILARILTVLIHVPAIPKFRSGGKILDIGCGTGDTLVQLKDLGWNVYGVDIDKEAVAIAKRRGLTRVRFGSYTTIRNYRDGYFDVIRLYHVIEHLDNPDLLLRLAYKKLKHGGELIIGTPNADSLISRLAGRYWYNLDSPRHLFIFSPSTLERMLTKHTFTISYLDYCSIGGIVGSIQYYLRDTLGLTKKIIYNAWIIVLFYPVERALDWLRLGDIFIIHARKP